VPSAPLPPRPAAGASWTNEQPLLPPALTEADCAALLAKCALLRELEGKGRQQEARQALLLASTCAVSSAFLAALQDRVEGEARAAAHQALKERKGSGAGGLARLEALAGCCWLAGWLLLAG
jgi:hypothetical protein